MEREAAACVRWSSMPPGNRLAYRLLWHKDKPPAPGVALVREVISG